MHGACGKHTILKAIGNMMTLLLLSLHYYLVPILYRLHQYLEYGFDIVYI